MEYKKSQFVLHLQMISLSTLKKATDKGQKERKHTQNLDRHGYGKFHKLKFMIAHHLLCGTL